jgi:ketosteroid isomerase-like protein
MASTRGKVARFITISISCIGLAVSTLACSKLPAENNNRGNERTQAEAAIRQQEDAQIKAIGARQLDATVSYYGNGAILSAPNAPDARSKDEIRQTWAQILASVPAGVPFNAGTTQVEVANSNDLGYALGFYTIDNPPSDKGTFVDIWKKQTDGSWKTMVAVIKSDMPPAPPPAR